jgi:hypothetical protein
MSDLFTDVLHEGCRILMACAHDDEAYEHSEVHRHRCSAPDGIGAEEFWVVAETIAAKSGCRRSDRSNHHGCRRPLAKTMVANVIL